MSYPNGAEALLIAMQTPAPKGHIGIPVLLWGQPGIGKSSFLEGMEREDFSVLTLIASIHDPTDFSGLPVHHEGKVKYAVPEWVSMFSEEKGGLLFLDELTTAPPSVQAALLRVVLERKVGFHRLPDSVRIVSAANPPDMITGGWELSPPLRNRFVHLHWSMPTSLYREALETGFDKAILPNIDKEAHAERLPSWKLKVAAFLKLSPTLLHSSSEEDQYGFASPRTWDFVAHLLASCDILDQAPTKENTASKACIELIKGCIGTAAALPFLSFLKDLKLPDPNRVLRKPELVNINSLNDSELYVLFGAVTNVLESQKESPEFFVFLKNYMTLTQAVFDNGRRDLIYVSLRKMAKARLLEKGMDAAAKSSTEERNKIIRQITTLFSDPVFSEYIEIFEN